MREQSWYSELSGEFVVKVWMHRGSVLSCFLFAVVVVVVNELAKQGVLSCLLYADDLVLMNETIEGLGNNFMKWRESFDCKGLKANLEGKKRNGQRRHHKG